MQRLLVFMYAVLFISASCFASSMDDYSNFLVTAQIVATNGVFEVRPLSFGTILKGNSTQKVKINPKEENKQGQSGKFVIVGRKNQNFLAMLKKSDINMSYKDEYMKVKNFILSTQGNKPVKVLKGRLKSDATEIFVGATLVIPKNQKPGYYSGKNTIVVYMY